MMSFTFGIVMLPQLFSKGSSSQERVGMLLGFVFWATYSTAAAVMQGDALTQVAVDIFIPPTLRTVVLNLTECVLLLFGASPTSRT